MEKHAICFSRFWSHHILPTHNRYAWEYHLLLIKLHPILGNTGDYDVLQLPFIYLAVAIGVVHLSRACLVIVRIGLDSDQDQKEPSQDGAVFIPHGGDW